MPQHSKASDIPSHGLEIKEDLNRNNIVKDNWAMKDESRKWMTLIKKKKVVKKTVCRFHTPKSPFLTPPKSMAKSSQRKADKHYKGCQF